MANKNGYITVFEASDAGTGDPRKTIWQFFVDRQPVVTTNPQIAKTARLAIETAARVDVTYDENNGNVVSQVRMEFRYVCNAEPIRDCRDAIPHEPGVTYICDTKRYIPCEPQPNG